MRISELSTAADVPVGTIKYYLREGLLAGGRRTSRTTADYDEAHVERLRLIRALVGTGGLGIAAVKRVVAVLEGPSPGRLELLATAQDALTADGADGAAGTDGADGTESADGADGTESADGADGIASADGADGIDPAGRGTSSPGVHGAGRARSWVIARGWPAGTIDPVVERLEAAWRACEEAGILVDDTLMGAYADAVEHVARVDVAAVPPETDGAVRRVIVGTVMMEPVLSALRLLAQRHVSVQQEGSRGPDRPDC